MWCKLLCIPVAVGTRQRERTLHAFSPGLSCPHDNFFYQGYPKYMFNAGGRKVDVAVGTRQRGNLPCLFLSPVVVSSRQPFHHCWNPNAYNHPPVVVGARQQGGDYIIPATSLSILTASSTLSIPSMPKRSVFLTSFKLVRLGLFFTKSSTLRKASVSK